MDLRIRRFPRARSTLCSRTFHPILDPKLGQRGYFGSDGDFCKRGSDHPQAADPFKGGRVCSRASRRSIHAIHSAAKVKLSAENILRLPIVISRCRAQDDPKQEGVTLNGNALRTVTGQPVKDSCALSATIPYLHPPHIHPAQPSSPNHVFLPARWRLRRTASRQRAKSNKS
jgi:hypothetical protein